MNYIFGLLLIIMAIGVGAVFLSVLDASLEEKK